LTSHLKFNDKCLRVRLGLNNELVLIGMYSVPIHVRSKKCSHTSDLSKH